MIFKNRQEAAALLAERLIRYRGKKPLVLAIPRGAVPMGKIIADTLDGEMDVALVRKLRAPDQPELAIGSIDESGQVYWRKFAAEMGLAAQDISDEKERQLKTLRERRARYTPVRPPIDPAGRLVIVVDDGIATGASMAAALHAVRAKGPKKLIAAAAVAPYSSLPEIEKLADEVVCLYTPERFLAVGQFFEDFTPVSDEEVISILRVRPQSRTRKKTSEVSS